MKHINKILILSFFSVGVFWPNAYGCQAAPDLPKPVDLIKQVEKDEQSKTESESTPKSGEKRSHSDVKVALRSIEAAAKRGSFEWFGLSLEAAEKKAKQRNVAMRMVEKNGRLLPVTRDFIKGRLNIRVFAGKVIGVSIEGQNQQEGAALGLIPYLGLSEQQASALAVKKGVKIRTVARDNKSLEITADMIKDRVNIHVRGGIVIAVGHG